MSSVYNARLKNYEPNPSAIWLHAYDTLPGDIELSGATWDSVHSHISHIIIKTKSTNWDMYICEEQEEEDATVGTTMVWGQNNAGQIGDGTLLARLTPTQIIGDHKFVHIAKGNYGSTSSHALKEDGSAWSWGRNDYGQLGDNTRTYRSSPVSVVGNHSFIQISSGFFHTIALKENGEVWAWGGNTAGQLGTGNLNSYSSPVMIIGEHSFKCACAGTSFSIALKNDGSVYSWGDNSSGELGDNTNTNKSSPIPIVGNHSFISITTGSVYSLALRKDGIAWGWGNNASSRIGDGTSTNRSSPVSLAGGHSYIQISANGTFGSGLKEDGTAWTWGLNVHGQLGVGDTTLRATPTSVIGNHSFIYLSGSTHNMIALKEDGSGWSCGWNAYGQLGDGTTISKSSPISIITDKKFCKIDSTHCHTVGLLAEPAGKITTTKIASNKIGDACLPINSSFNSSTNRIFLKYVDKSGHNPCDIYLLGEKRGGIKKNKPSVLSMPETSHPLMKNISSIWLFNEGSKEIVHDYSGNERHGTIGLLGSPSGAEWTTGTFGAKLKFPGNAAAAISVPNAQTLFGPSVFSIATAYNGDSDIANYAGLFEAKPTTGTQRLEFRPFIEFSPNRRCIFTVGPNEGNLTTQHEAYVSSSTLGEDAYSVCIYDQENYRNIYSITENHKSISQANRADYAGIPFFIGKRSTTNAPFKGTIEYLMIWQRILTTEEIIYLNEYPWCMFKGHAGY